MVSVENIEIDQLIKDLVFEIQSQMDQEYQDSYDFIASKCVNEGEECDLSVLCSIEDQMNLVSEMSKELTVEKSVQSNPQ
jgi:hypothetical protein